MAQPTNYVFNYIGGKQVHAGDVLTSDAILALDATIKVIQLRSDNVRVSINGTDAVPFKTDDIAYVIAGKTWTFLNDAELAYGNIINLGI